MNLTLAFHIARFTAATITVAQPPFVAKVEQAVKDKHCHTKIDSAEPNVVHIIDGAMKGVNESQHNGEWDRYHGCHGKSDIIGNLILTVDSHKEDDPAEVMSCDVEDSIHDQPKSGIWLGPLNDRV